METLQQKRRFEYSVNNVKLIYNSYFDLLLFLGSKVGLW